MTLKPWMLPAALAGCIAIALLSALPQLRGLAAIAVAPPISSMFRTYAQIILFAPILIAITSRDIRRLVWVIPVILFATLYAWFPAPFFDYIWDVCLIESVFLLLCAEALSPTRGIWLLRLLLFKLMFCMGVVKFLHGMPEWHDGTAMKYFWQNQPMPGFLSWHFSQLPDMLQRLLTLFVFIVEVPGPFLIFIGRRSRLVYFFINLALQIGIFISGNYGFFNILTVAISFSLWSFVPHTTDRSNRIQFPLVYRYARILVLFIVFGWFTTSLWYTYKTVFPGNRYLHETSWIFLKNAEQREMLAPIRGTLKFFAAAKVSNPYALFGMIPKYRMEIGIESSIDGKTWQKYDFKIRPSALARAPIWYAPHHWRLDHQMYYESFRIRDPQMHEKYSFFLGVRWMPNFIGKLFTGDASVCAHLLHCPLSENPNYLRMRYLYYTFTTSAEKTQSGNYWKTESPHPGQFNEAVITRENYLQLP